MLCRAFTSQPINEAADQRRGLKGRLNLVKTNLLNRLCNLFRRTEVEYDYDEYDEYSEEYSDVPVEEAGADEGAYDQTATATVASGRTLEMPQGAGAPDVESQDQGVHVPLGPIVSGMPLELQSRLLHEVGDLSIFLPVDKILPQLATGAVSVTFGELRNAAPKVFKRVHAGFADRRGPGS